MEERNKLLREMQLKREAVDIQAQMDEVVRERKLSKISEDEVVRYTLLLFSPFFSYLFCFQMHCFPCFFALSIKNLDIIIESFAVKIEHCAFFISRILSPQCDFLQLYFF